MSNPINSFSFLIADGNKVNLLLSFKNLKLKMLLMYDNEIEVIEDDALERSENTLLVLHIYNNKIG
jgi:hypothetical protein